MANQMTVPGPARAASGGWTGRRFAMATGVVVGSLILALVVAYGAMVAVFNWRPPACDPWDCTASDVTETIWVGLVAGVVTLVSLLLLCFKRFVR